jgi:hypothetical protein
MHRLLTARGGGGGGGRELSKVRKRESERRRKINKRYMLEGTERVYKERKMG